MGEGDPDCALCCACTTGCDLKRCSLWSDPYIAVERLTQCRWPADLRLNIQYQAWVAGRSRPLLHYDTTYCTNTLLRTAARFLLQPRSYRFTWSAGGLQPRFSRNSIVV